MTDVAARSTIDPLAPFHPAVREWFTRGVRRADAAAGARLAGDRARRLDADPRADRQRQDAGGVPLVPRSADVRAGAAQGGALPRALRVAAQGAGGRRRAQPARAARRHRADRRRRAATPSSTPAIAIRTGDTPQSERARFQREPADILITTPESLYLLLTSNAREALRSVDTVIIDEIHALVPTKRGAHLALSLERLAALCDQPPQRIGLSATQRPLDEVARFLGGVDSVDRVGAPATARHAGAAEQAAAADGADSGSTPRSRDEFAVARGARPLPAGHHRRRRHRRRR